MNSFPFTACGILVLRTFMYIWQTSFMPRHSFYVYLTNSMNRASCLFCCKKAPERVDWFLHRPINIWIRRCFPRFRARPTQILAESAVSSPRASASYTSPPPSSSPPSPCCWSSSSRRRKLWCSPVCPIFGMTHPGLILTTATTTPNNLDPLCTNKQVTNKWILLKDLRIELNINKWNYQSHIKWTSLDASHSENISNVQFCMFVCNAFICICLYF